MIWSWLKARRARQQWQRGYEWALDQIHQTPGGATYVRACVAVGRDMGRLDEFDKGAMAALLLTGWTPNQ